MKTLLVEMALIAETLGRILATGGESDAAYAAWEAGLEVLPDAAQCDLLQAAARLLLVDRLGLDQEKSRLIKRIDGTGFRDPRFAKVAIHAAPDIE